MVVVPFEDAKFVPVHRDEPDGPAIAVLWGDPQTGPSAMFIRLKRESLPMHSHSSAYHLLVVRGLVKHWSDADSEANAKVLGPGSYWYQPGDADHGDACVSDECVAFLVWAGKRDGKLAKPIAK